MVQSEPRTPPPPWPQGGNTPSGRPPRWNAPTQVIRVEPERSDQWGPYAVFGGITVLIGCIAMVVVALAR